MRKRKTKAQREAEQREALHQRIADIFAGAQGFPLADEEEWPMPDVLARVIPAVCSIWGIKQGTYISKPIHLDDWGRTVPEISDWLYDRGLRADSSCPAHMQEATDA